jgi:type VI secretion system protein ImpJ
MLTDARSIPEAVLWHEGMLLSPQHFQLTARRSEALGAYLIETAAPFCWGVRRLQIDASILLEGIFRVVELEAVMPDGLLVLYSASDDEPSLKLDLKSAELDPRSASLTVHVAVAARTEHVASSGALRRYHSVEGRPIVDENTRDNELAVPRLRPALSLHVTQSPLHSPSNKYVSLPLARISFRDERYVLESYEPPRIGLAPDSLLDGCARRIALQLREKALVLGESLQSARRHGNEADTRTTVDSLRAVVRNLPRLEAMLESGVGHPFPVYLTLCDVVGDIAVIGRQFNLPQLSAYEHRDPLPPFQEIAVYVERVLATLREAFRSVRFTRLDSGRFGVAMRAGWLGDTLIIGARIGPGQASDAVRKWIEDALIASASRMRVIRENRVLGATRDIVLEAPELELVAPPNVLLWRVGAEAFAIVPDDTLEVAGAPEAAGGGEPLELLLYLPAGLIDRQSSAEVE